MNTTNDDIMDVAAIDDWVAIEDEIASTDFAEQKPIEGGLTVADLTATSCRWPSGNPRDLATFRYCGEAASGSPYCERHARLAYLPRNSRPATSLPAS
jgi:GcrA cell cycle regulator